MNKNLLTTIVALTINILLNKLVYAYPDSHHMRTSDGNRQFNVEYNQHGAVLSSQKLKIYLGRSCDAYSPYYGYGYWGQANGGMIIYFPNHRLGFPRQGIYIRNCSI